MKVLDLFSGIGGFSLGLERAGFRTVAFCEVDKKARQVIKKHWPDVPIYEDVRNLTYEKLTADGVACIDVICGGFPCQDISVAGKGAGIKGQRSGLWSELSRLIGEIRPKYAIVENVSALRSSGLSRVLGDLAEVGYDAQWHCIPASAIGAPHQRDRVWIVAYPERIGRNRGSVYSKKDVGANEKEPTHPFERPNKAFPVSDSKRCEKQRLFILLQQELARAEHCGCWKTEPDVGRVVDGLPGRVDRLKQLGNAVVPQIPELIGKAILKSEYYFPMKRGKNG